MQSHVSDCIYWFILIHLIYKQSLQFHCSVTHGLNFIICSCRIEFSFGNNLQSLLKSQGAVKEMFDLKNVVRTLSNSMCW